MGSKRKSGSLGGSACTAQTVYGGGTAALAICSRAHPGLVRARAESFLRGGEQFDNTELRQSFGGRKATRRSTELEDRRFRDFSPANSSVSGFWRLVLGADIERMIPADISHPVPPATASEELKIGSGGSLGEPKALRVFLCHASGDKALVRNLYKSLKQDGFEPWLDEEDLVPGQDWEAEIRKAVRSSGVVLVCLSSRAVNKEGFVQKEIKFALDCADEKPPDTIFLIPVKLEECPVPDRLSRWHWVDLTEATGHDKLLVALRKRAGAPERNAADLPKELPSNAFESAAQASRAEAALRIFAPELARILAQQIHILDRSITNFICASVESKQRPNDHWTTFKPSKPSLYPSATEFRDLSSQDCALLVEFYDSINQIEDVVNRLHESEIEWDVNAWNVLMQGACHSVYLGVRAAERLLHRASTVP